jgi:hypothetical protein
MAPSPKAHNANWLLHTLFARGQVEICTKIITKQLLVAVDKEFLFYMQVRITYRRYEAAVK